MVRMQLTGGPSTDASAPMPPEPPIPAVPPKPPVPPAPPQPPTPPEPPAPPAPRAAPPPPPLAQAARVNTLSSAQPRTRRDHQQPTCQRRRPRIQDAGPEPSSELLRLTQQLLGTCITSSSRPPPLRRAPR